MIKQAIKNRLFGRSRYQAFWERLYHWSLAGMNIGNYEPGLDSGELWVLDHVNEELGADSSKVVFDVGANRGLYAREVVARFGESAHVYCFEPARETYAVLKERMSPHKGVECLNFALGEKEQSSTLFSYSRQDEFASMYDRSSLRDANGNGSSGPTEEQIQIKTLDGFCSTHGIDRINLLKLDVEGHELKVLEGAVDLLQKRGIDFIQFEFGGTQMDSRTFVRDFQDLLEPSFEIYRILKDGVRSIESFNGTHEIFVYSNFLAVSHDFK